MSKRILFVANVCKEHILKFHVPTIKKMKEEGWVVDVACSGEEKVPYCDNQFNMSWERSPFSPNLIKGIIELKNIVNKNHYDIMYCHTPVGGLAARITGIGARKRGTKIIYFAHGYHFYKGAPAKNWILYYTLEKIMSKMTDAIILINREDYNLTVKHFNNCDAYLINGIGVDMKRFYKITEKNRLSYRKKLGIPTNAVVLIYFAELLANKNQTFLMHVLKEILVEKNDVFLVLAGSDYSNGKFLNKAKKIGVQDNVRFLGWRDDIAGLYGMSDICTASSIREGFGLNLVEAMACGIPVVATKNRGHETIIVDGDNGYLISLGDVNCFKERILKVINDDRCRLDIVSEGYKSVGKYDSNKVVQNLMDIINKYCKNEE
ncbi:MAG: glycosyltransferase family 4 protein [Erysipelotrichaceae bacterium]